VTNNPSQLSCFPFYFFSVGTPEEPEWYAFGAQGVGVGVLRLWRKSLTTNRAFYRDA